MYDGSSHSRRKFKESLWNYRGPNNMGPSCSRNYKAWKHDTAWLLLLCAIRNCRHIVAECVGLTAEKEEWNKRRSWKFDHPRTLDESCTLHEARISRPRTMILKTMYLGSGLHHCEPDAIIWGTAYLKTPVEPASPRVWYWPTHPLKSSRKCARCWT